MSRLSATNATDPRRNDEGRRASVRLDGLPEKLNKLVFGVATVVKVPVTTMQVVA